MGFFNDRELRVLELAEEGARPLTISALTGIALDEVYDILEQAVETGGLNELELQD